VCVRVLSLSSLDVGRLKVNALACGDTTRSIEGVKTGGLTQHRRLAMLLDVW
jgi:hypothetical protein